MSRIPHQPQTINFATKYHAPSGYSSHDRGVQISFTRPRTGAGIARKPRAGPVEWIKIYISADHRHLKFNFHLFTSHSFGLLFHETKLFAAVKENRLFWNLKLKYFLIFLAEIIWSPTANLCRSRTMLRQPSTRAITARWVRFALTIAIHFALWNMNHAAQNLEVQLKCHERRIAI